ncbi:hypothetical protein HAX54_018952 [Datura stramonium]|uniref:Uncharacterized protein n=1 Tax=Datura stramonium TaxID=4076 RepID=A0ABS8UN52_DATST|nr:hypothetical protein [Datura stramonium]
MAGDEAATLLQQSECEEEEERRGFILLVPVFSHRNSEAARRVSLFVFVSLVEDGDGSTVERKRVARRVSLFMLCGRGGTREFEGGWRCEEDKVLQRFWSKMEETEKGDEWLQQRRR